MVKFSVKLSNILGLSFYRYELTSSNYNPNIDSAITLTVKVTDIFGNPVNNKTVQLYLNGSSLGESYQLTTNTNGIATATYTPNTYGTYDFSIANQHIQINVNQYTYEIKSSNYNPKINTNITLTCNVKDNRGNNVSGKSVQFYRNGSSLGSATTNSSGNATVTYNCSTWGIQDFSVANQHIQVDVDGWKLLNGSDGAKWYLYRNKNYAKLIINGVSTSSSTSYSQFGGSAYASSCRPNQTVLAYENNSKVIFRVNNSGQVHHRSLTGSSVTQNSYIEMMWAIRDSDL